MRRVWGGSAIAMLAMLLRAGLVRAQTNDPVGLLPVWGVVRPPRHRAPVPYPMPETTTYGVLDEMASRASVIFVGSVRSVRWSGGSDSGMDVASGVVAVEFAVEEGIVGPASGSTYIVREWAGLWRDADRFRVGQRRLMLLHAPGPAGLSSPVDGLDGAIPITAEAGLPGAASVTVEAGVHGVDAATPVVLPVSRADLRWIQAKQMRTVVLAGEPVLGPGEQPAEPLVSTATPVQVAGPALAPSAGRPSSLGSAVVVAQPLPVERTPALSEVIGRLRIAEGPRRAAQ